MSFSDAVSTCLTTKFATFSGRARRSEYWWFVLFIVLIPIVGFVVLLVFFVQDSQPGSNQYGPSPKGEGAPATA